LQIFEKNILVFMKLFLLVPTLFFNIAGRRYK
jgi:hypothetical protein